MGCDPCSNSKIQKALTGPDQTWSFVLSRIRIGSTCLFCSLLGISLSSSSDIWNRLNLVACLGWSILVSVGCHVLGSLPSSFNRFVFWPDLQYLLRYLPDTYDIHTHLSNIRRLCLPPLLIPMPLSIKIDSHFAVGVSPFWLPLHFSFAISKISILNVLGERLFTVGLLQGSPFASALRSQTARTLAAQKLRLSFGGPASRGALQAGHFSVSLSFLSLAYVTMQDAQSRVSVNKIMSLMRIVLVGESKGIHHENVQAKRQGERGELLELQLQPIKHKVVNNIHLPPLPPRLVRFLSSCCHTTIIHPFLQLR